MPPEEEPEGRRKAIFSDKRLCFIHLVEDMQHSLPLVVGEGDSLRGHFEVDHGGHGGRVGTQSHGGGLLHRLDACQGLHFHRGQVPNVTGCRKIQGKKRRCSLVFISFSKHI